jgi:hypothetical protein
VSPSIVPFKRYAVRAFVSDKRQSQQVADPCRVMNLFGGLAR